MSLVSLVKWDVSLGSADVSWGGWGGGGGGASHKDGCEED